MNVVPEKLVPSFLCAEISVLHTTPSPFWGNPDYGSDGINFPPQLRSAWVVIAY